ncbi:hypothetical protein [Stieleria neptunia]|nr:hypothetical protein [Stieleria neptunia]
MDADQKEPEEALKEAALIRVTNSLSDITRRQRKALLSTSTVGCVVGWTGAVPKKIAPLGIDFPADDQAGFLYCLLGVIAYFAVGFAVYAWSDFTRWRIGIMAAELPVAISGVVDQFFPVKRSKIEERPEYDGSDYQIVDATIDELKNEVRRQFENSSRIAIATFIVDYVVPVLVAIAGFGFLICQIAKLGAEV